MRPLRLVLLSLVSIALMTVAAAADDWTATRLRGVVFQFANGAWQQVHRNDVVPDGNAIRTAASGYADFTRGAETVSVGPQTQIVISDKGGVKPFTTVRQDFGTVTVDAEVENVQHFAVETPYLAAVVKGTKFVVTSGPKGASVKVLRGHVECDDKLDKYTALLSVGQTATVTAGGAYTLSGGGKAASGGMTVTGSGVLPDVVDAAGNVVSGAGTVVGKVVGSANGVANGLVNGVANGLKGLTGKDDNNGNGTGNGNSGDSQSGGNGDGLLGLHLKLGLPIDAEDTVPGLWV